MFFLLFKVTQQDLEEFVINVCNVQIRRLFMKIGLEVVPIYPDTSPTNPDFDDFGSKIQYLMDIPWFYGFYNGIPMQNHQK